MRLFKKIVKSSNYYVHTKRTLTGSALHIQMMWKTEKKSTHSMHKMESAYVKQKKKHEWNKTWKCRLFKCKCGNFSPYAFHGDGMCFIFRKSLCELMKLKFIFSFHSLSHTQWNWQSMEWHIFHVVVATDCVHGLASRILSTTTTTTMTKTREETICAPKSVWNSLLAVVDLCTW